MKSFVKKMALSLALIGSCSVLAACSGDKTENKTNGGTEEEQKDYVADFVAVSSSGWDVDVTIGSYKYTFDLKLKNDKTAAFAATCTSKVQQSQGGGGGFPGFFGAVSNDTGAAEEETEDLTAKNFTKSGTWEEQTGYGYVLTLDGTTYHIDFDKQTGRHQFYIDLTITDGSAYQLMQYVDASYSSKLASDYKMWDERDSTYIFYAEATGNNSSVSTQYLYMHKDGTTVINSPNGSSRSQAKGPSWKVENSVISLVNGDQVLATSESSLSSATHSGYRLVYNGYAYFCSTNSNYKWYEMTSEDFDGKTLYQFTGTLTTSGPMASTTEYYLNLTANGMYLYAGKSLSKKGTYTFADETFTLTFDGEEAVTVTKGADGSYTYTMTIETTSMWGGTSKNDVVLTYTPAA